MTGTLCNSALEELISGGISIETPKQFKTVGQVTSYDNQIGFHIHVDGVR